MSEEQILILAGLQPGDRASSHSHRCFSPVHLAIPVRSALQTMHTLLYQILRLR